MQCFTVKLPDERFVVNVSNFPASVTAKVAETAISEAIRSSTSIAHTLEVTDIPSPTVARLRFNDKMPPADRVVINEALKNVSEGSNMRMPTHVYILGNYFGRPHFDR